MKVTRYAIDLLEQVSPLTTLMLTGWTCTGQMITWPTKGLLNFVDKPRLTLADKDGPCFTSFRLSKGKGKTEKSLIVMVRTPFCTSPYDTASYQRCVQWAARLLTTNSVTVFANTRGELTEKIAEEIDRVYSAKQMHVMNFSTIMDNDKAPLLWCGDLEQVTGVSLQPIGPPVVYEERELPVASLSPTGEVV
jgi:hypothetical protein